MRRLVMTARVTEGKVFLIICICSVFGFPEDGEIELRLRLVDIYYPFGRRSCDELSQSTAIG